VLVYVCVDGIGEIAGYLLCLADSGEDAKMKENVEYIKVFADYESDDMPVVYLYEVDLEDERLALRAIEIFADRKVKCIEDFYRDVIEILSIPSVAELNSGEWGGGFFALAIREEEFEEIWNSDSYMGRLSAE
jgi:hypothetical protein